MSTSPENEFAEMREEIVAYLDGELSTDQTVIVERRLATDESYRAELQQLQKTWDMLDHLPHTTASADFTRSTMEMAAVKAKTIQRRSLLSRFNWHWLAACVAVLCCGLAGYAFSAAGVPRPNDELARDLGLLDNFEMFEEISSIEFLERLDEQGVFDYVIDTQSRVRTDDDSTDEQNETISNASLETMNSRELFELKRKKEKFDSLSSDESVRYRKLHAALDTHSNREELLRVAAEYNRWLSRLPLPQRNELAEMKIDEQLARVNELRREQAVEELGLNGETRLSPADFEKTARWLEKFCKEKANRIYKAYIRQEADSGVDARNSMRNRSWIRDERAARFVFTRLRPESADDILEKSDIASLAATLSPEAAGILQKSREDDNLLKLLQNCMTATFWDRMKFNEQELQRFFEEQLTETQQSQLDWLSPENRHEILNRLYQRFGLAEQKVPENIDVSKIPGRRRRGVSPQRGLGPGGSGSGRAAGPERMLSPQNRRPDSD